MCINNNQAVSQIKAYSVADPKELQIKWKREREKNALETRWTIKNDAINKAKTTLYQFEKEDKRRRKKFLMLSSQC